MPFEWFVALRYLREGRMQTILILCGVSVGIGVIIFLAALIDGLQVSLIDKTLGYQAHIVVRPPDEMPRVLPGDPSSASSVLIEKPAQRLRSISQWPQILQTVERIPGIAAVCPTVTGAGFANRGTASKSIALRGVDPERFDRIVHLSGAMVGGRYRISGTEALIGITLAHDLGVNVGDKIRLLTADGRDGIFSISGIFDLNNQDVNERWVVVSLHAAQTLLNLSGGISGLEVKVDRVFQAEILARQIAERTGLTAESWMALNAQLLTGLRSQNSSRYLIQTFFIIAVALGIASVLVVWVVQKNREIGILRALGTSRRKIMRIFLIQGGLLGVGGWGLGSILGTALSLFFAGLARNPDGTPRFPVELSLRLFAGTAILAALTGLVAAVAPARRAAGLDPATTIHRG
jgi:lipoprotein-releasing system permease protein